MILENSKIESVGDIIKSGSKENCQLFLNITFYQRPYRWPNTRIQALFSDFAENRRLAEKERGDKDKAKKYFLGAVVLVEKRNDEKKREYEVIDGQQRLTTIYLMNYLKFILLRSEVEELIQFNPSNIKEELDMMIRCYESFVGTKNSVKMRKMQEKIYAIIDTHGSGSWEKTDINKILSAYRTAVGLPKSKNLTDVDKYYEESVDANKKFLEKEKFCLNYEYEEYTTSLREALAQIIVIYSKDREPSWELIQTSDDEDNEKEWPFINRACDILEGIKELYTSSTKAGLTDPSEIVKAYISLLNEMIDNLNVCEIITKNPDDAYKLFETLNDRSEGVSDLELMKDYFYRYYVKESGDGKMKKRTTLIEMDKIWSDSLNRYEKDIRFWIAYCSTVYITGRGLLKTDKLKGSIDVYLKSVINKNGKYTSDDIRKDFDVISKTSIIIEKISKGNLKDIAFWTENETEASIVKTALAMLLQLEYTAVAAAVICDILYNYANINYANTNPVPFEDYIDEVFHEKNCINKYSTMWEEVCVLWKSAILSENYVMPKNYADSIISNRCSASAISGRALAACVAITSTAQKSLEDEFKTWANTWQYNKNSYAKTKIKLLFFHLMNKYDKNIITSPATEDELEYLSSQLRSFPKDVVKKDLDHVEARKIKSGRESEFYKYDDRIKRSIDIDGLGNMMILDKPKNVQKQNPPMGEGIEFYNRNCNTHWLIQEMNDLFDSNHMTNSAGKTVPTQEFFETRKQRLLECFWRMVRDTDSKHVNVKVPK